MFFLSEPLRSGLRNLDRDAAAADAQRRRRGATGILCESYRCGGDWSRKHTE